MRGFFLREIHQVRLLTPYLKEFVECLKEAIPYRSLRWEPDTKSWVVKHPYINDALEVASEFYERMDELRLADGQAEPSPSASSSASSHDTIECVRRVREVYREEAVLHLLPNAPLEVIVAAYRAMAKLVHPDLGGSHEHMKAVNGAYETLRRLAEEQRG